MLRTHEEKGTSIAWHNVILQTYFACYAGGLVVALGRGLTGRKERVTVFNLRALTCTVGVSLPFERRPPGAMGFLSAAGTRRND